MAYSPRAVGSPFSLADEFYRSLFQHVELLYGTTYLLAKNEHVGLTGSSVYRPNFNNCTKTDRLFLFSLTAVCM